MRWASLSSLEFLHATQLNVGQTQNADGNEAKSHDVAPQVPRRFVGDALKGEEIVSGRRNTE